VTVQDRDEAARIVRNLRRSGFGTLDLSEDEVAKGHMRYMVGGHLHRAKGGARELLYRFEFPERRGALMKFLAALNPGWNISLFHYRNLGADYGSILVGLQVPRMDRREFRRFLDRLGYPHADETRNPAYRLFLG
ncbi:MAG: threonine ammonia-lyase, biosynthetic, partial [Burkholderiales bacterium]|nr:threonine ammonia-lyase, biosynthetic [Burkholderiales bacterium]